MGRGGSYYSITTPKGITYSETWYGSEDTFKQLVSEGKIHWTDGGSGVPRVKIYLKDAEKDGQAAINFFTPDKYGSNQEGSSELETIFQIKGIFDNPKPTRLIKSLIQLATDDNSIIVDFFSGSSTTADAIYQINHEVGSSRTFILIQLPEATPKESIAFKNGYKTITDIGEERIRRVSKAIVNQRKQKNFESSSNIDLGFRVFKVDSSNLNNIYYNPQSVRKDILDYAADNIKSDRTSDDLLIQVMLELGVDLSSTIVREFIDGKEIISVDDGYLIACFDNDVNEDLVTKIADREPYYAIFRDSSMSSDSVAINFTEIFKTRSPNTKTKVL